MRRTLQVIAIHHNTRRIVGGDSVTGFQFDNVPTVTAQLVFLPSMEDATNSDFSIRVSSGEVELETGNRELMEGLHVGREIDLDISLRP